MNSLIGTFPFFWILSRHELTDVRLTWERFWPFFGRLPLPTEAVLKKLTPLRLLCKEILQFGGEPSATANHRLET